MVSTDINPQTIIEVLIEQRNDALNRLVRCTALNIELEKEIDILKRANETTNEQEVEVKE
tara:strand:- start:309 stop:488 length:180 start_codon:yes stop_codon:yes gene_type:complete